MKIKITIHWKSGPVEEYTCDWEGFQKTDHAIYINSERIPKEDILLIVVTIL